MNLNAFNEMIVKIISEQENIIGPLAVEQAKKVTGLKIDWQHHQITINGNEKMIIDGLIKQYEKYLSCID